MWYLNYKCIVTFILDLNIEVKQTFSRFIIQRLVTLDKGEPITQQYIRDDEFFKEEKGMLKHLLFYTMLISSYLEVVI